MTFDNYMLNASPEQKIFLERAVLKAGSNQIMPFFLQASFSSSELITYAANKLYFALQLELFWGVGVTAGAVQSIVYDENNAAFLNIGDNIPVYDGSATTIKYVPQTVVLKNIYFSRINSNFQYVKFIGFKSIS